MMKTLLFLLAVWCVLGLAQYLTQPASSGPGKAAHAAGLSSRTADARAAGPLLGTRYYGSRGAPRELTEKTRRKTPRGFFFSQETYLAVSELSGAALAPTFSLLHGV